MRCRRGSNRATDHTDQHGPRITRITRIYTEAGKSVRIGGSVEIREDSRPGTREDPSPIAGQSVADTAITFILRLGRALHAYGYSADQLESMLTATAARLGLEGQFLSTPTSILAAIGSLPAQRTFLLRTEPGTIDLGKLAELDALQAGVLDRRLTPAQGLERIDDLLAKEARYGPIARVMASALGSGTASVFSAAGRSRPSWRRSCASPAPARRAHARPCDRAARSRRHRIQQPLVAAESRGRTGRRKRVPYGARLRCACHRFADCRRARSRPASVPKPSTLTF